MKICASDCFFQMLFFPKPKNEYVWKLTMMWSQSKLWPSNREYHASDCVSSSCLLTVIITYSNVYWPWNYNTTQIFVSNVITALKVKVIIQHTSWQITETLLIKILHSTLRRSEYSSKCCYIQIRTNKESVNMLPNNS